MPKYKVQAYCGSCEPSGTQDSHRYVPQRFSESPAPSDSNAELEKTFNLAAGTDVAPLLARGNPSSPALGLLSWETPRKEIPKVRRMEKLLLRAPFLYINLLETQLSG